MTYWVAGLGFLAVIAFLWEKAARVEAEAKAERLALENEAYLYRLKDAAATAVRQLQALAFIKSEAERLSHELEACSVPGAVRERLDRVLARATKPRI